MPTAQTLISDDWLRSGVDALVILVEAAGALVIVAGAFLAFVRFVGVLPRRDADAFVPVRLTLGRFLALGLEFQLASDVLRTAIAPSFEELGKLAAVAAIRTALNFFLAREIREEQDVIARDHDPAQPRPPATGPHTAASRP
ncbi:DUF1622 domain-containing protein [Angustibacter sp. Root456]|uniref:DUF1622 domain-containing protein n=1 Tax=Angustibacter sp. Root456 TaxID=1736539 RepID=UPI0006FD8E8D|nr:DUF1622 domain-containing protein [Angustibacter sp. Root456]KQX69752.1 hypothetical protein ASD06_01595 [Angustibacter sp. Root456]